MTLPVMPDSSDRVIELAKAQRVGGWYIDRSLVPIDKPVEQAMPTWLEFIKANPDCTLPGGVAGALVAFFERKNGSGS